MNPDPTAVRTETEAQRLLHELEVHQIELQMQNVELRNARDEAEAVLEKYTDLYDFAPVGYFTLDGKGTILMANLTGTSLVGIDRCRLIGRSFGLLVSPVFRTAFNDLLGEVAEDQVKQSIDSELLYQGRRPTAVNIEVQRSSNGREWRVVAMDITRRKQVEDELRRFNVELESLVQQRTAVIEVKLVELREEIAERRRLEEEILEIGESARATIGQDLHDDLGQQLVSIGILMDLLSGELTAESHPLAEDAIQLTTFLTRSLVTTRNLAKSLYPVELERGGLILSLQDLAQRTELLSGIVCTMHSDGAFRFAKAAEIHLYRIVQESISNALKHGKARHIAIDCTALRGNSTLTVSDDGSDFELPVEGIGTGIGLHLFQYRARLIGAGITVTPGKNGGCLVTCQLGKPIATLPGG